MCGVTRLCPLASRVCLQRRSAHQRPEASTHAYSESPHGRACGYLDPRSHRRRAHQRCRGAQEAS